MFAGLPPQTDREIYAHYVVLDNHFVELIAIFKLSTSRTTHFDLRLPDGGLYADPMVKKNTEAPSPPRTGSPKSFRNLLTFRLHMVARLSERVSEEYYRRQFDLSLPECRVIGITGGYGSVSFKKVASDTYLEKSYASRVVSSLVERDILEKLDNPADSRSVLLRLTDHGMKVHDEMHQAAIRLNDWLTATMAAEQPQAFTTTLRQLEGRLDTLSQSFEAVKDVEEAVKNTGTVAPADKVETIQIDRSLAETLAVVLAAQLKT